MALVHTGEKPAFFEDSLHPGSEEVYYFSWSGAMQPGQAISVSAWQVSAGLTVVEEYTDQSIVDRETGETHTNCNGVRIIVDANTPPGIYYACNTVEFTGGAPYKLTREFGVTVKAARC